MAKFCPECGNPIIETNMPFCPKCGTRLSLKQVDPTSPAVQLPLVQQVKEPSYSILPAIKELKTTHTKSRSSIRSFHYSYIFYLVVILDLIISVFIGLICIFNMFNPELNNIPFNLVLTIILSINFIIDIYLIKNARKSPNIININSCWIKCFFAFFGIFTMLSCLYFLIIGIRMNRAYESRVS